MKKNLQVEVSFLGTAIALLFAIAPLSAAAQDAESGSAGIPWGPIVAYPEGTVTVKRNNNIYSRPSGEKSDTITVFAPSLKLEAKDGPHTYDITARVEDGHYSNATSADYTDYGLTANAAWVFSGRSGLKLTVGYLDGHDEQGAVPGAGFHTKPDDWHETSFLGLAGYGAPGAQGRVEVDFGLISKEYDNFKRDAFGDPDNMKRDYDTARLGGTFFWRVMPKTQLLFRVARADYDYDQQSFTYVGLGPNAGQRWTTLDSTETTYQVGVTWEAAAKTTGIFRIGTTKKDYSKSNLDDTSDISWNATVRWSPLTYSIFEFTTAQTPNESNIGNSSLDANFGVNWNHAWNSRLSSTVAYNYTESDYQSNPGIAEQKDKTDVLNLKLNYRWTRNIKVGAGYEYTDRSSNNPGSEFKRDIFSIFLNASI